MAAMSRVTRSLLGILAAMFINAATTAVAQEKGEIDIGYYALKPSIVSNLTGGPKYIRCDIQLMTESASEIPNIALHSAALRHRILMLIAGQDGNHLQSRAGKEELRKAALDAIQAQLEELTGKRLVDDLYFTAYYVK
jgi:flagellar FliL protein